MIDKVPNFNFNFSLTNDIGDDNEAFKFDLFLMTREIKQISDSLKHVALLPKTQQQAWVKSNKKLLNKFMDRLTHDMLDVLDDISLDQDVLQNTISCVTELRELVNIINGLMTGGSQLKS